MAKTITMKRNRKGQFVKNSSGRKRKHQKNYISAGAVVPNPHKKRRKHKSNPRRHHRRNPPSMLSLGGVMLPPVDTMVGVTVGLIGPPIVATAFTSYSPTTAQQNPTLVKLGSSVATIGGAYLIFGRKAARDVALGAIGGFLASQVPGLIKSLFPSLATSLGLSGYTRPVPRGGATGLGRARRAAGMGSYTQPVPRRNLAEFPARASRFASRFRRLQ